jgi:predicted ATPase/DNA-binding CsgD family transcriptional regulator
VTLEAGRGNLPRALAPLVGRAEAVADTAAALRASRLVTLTGVGGVGKTRLALAVAGEVAGTFPDGVWLVELGGVAESDAVADALASALGVTPRGNDRVIDTVAEAVAGRRLLVVVDNCEHVLAAAAAAITEVLARSDTPRVLATSRELLLAAGETVVPVAPLDVGSGMTSEAVTLFVQRAAAVRPSYAIHDEQTAAAVVEICRALDGLPLGIELAAARMAAMSATEVRDRLTDRMRLLTGPELAPERQSTLRQAVAWSYDLLDDDERAVLRAAAVFAGGFTLAPLCAVVGESDDVVVLGLLDSLVRKSLVVAQHETEQTRYALYDTIRLYAEEQLAAAGHLEESRDRHAACFAGEACRRWSRWNGPEWREQVDWVRAELANLRSACRWSVERGAIEVATDVAAHAGLMGFSVELFETVGWAEALLPAATRADVARLPRLYAAAGYACFVGRAAAARANAHRAAELEALPGYESCEPGYASFIEALGAVYCGDLDDYLALTGRVAGLPGTGQAYAVAAYVDGLQSAGRVDEAVALTDDATAAALALGNPYWIAYTLWIVGLAWSTADPPRALAVWDEGTAVVAEHGVRFFEGFMSRDAALLHTSHGQLDRALTLFATSIEAFLRSGAVAQLVITLASLPALLEKADQPGAARTLVAAMTRHPASLHHVPSLTALGQRLDTRLGSEAATRYAATGAGFDLPDAAAYALHRIEVAHRALGAAGDGTAGLTAREAQVLALIAGRATTREVSEQLFISAKTADNHIQHIYTKLGVTNRAAATRWALDHGLVEADGDPE